MRTPSPDLTNLRNPFNRTSTLLFSHKQPKKKQEQKNKNEKQKKNKKINTPSHNIKEIGKEGAYL